MVYLGISCPIIGEGGSGVVIRREKFAIKLPQSYRSGQNEDEQGVIQREEDVYRRLGDCEGVVQILNLSGPGIEMVWMVNGDLRNYLDKHQAPPLLQLTWFRQMARSLACIHDRRVIVADIATRNFLVATDLSVKFSDFTESSLFELDSDIHITDDNGYSIYTDIGQLGAVFYEVIMSKKCDFDLYEGQPLSPASAVWPRRVSLPNTQRVWLGEIIEKCWVKGAFRNAHELTTALSSATS